MKFLEYTKYILQVILYFSGIVFVIAYFKKNVVVKPIPPEKVKYKSKPDKKNLSEAEKADRVLKDLEGE